MNSDRIEEIQKATAYPEWNERAHKSNQLRALIDEKLQAFIDERIERERELQAENNKLRQALEALSNWGQRMKEARCEKCGKLLGLVEGSWEIKCQRCKHITLKLNGACFVRPAWTTRRHILGEKKWQQKKK